MRAGESTSPGSGEPKKIGRVKSFLAGKEIAEAAQAQAEAAKAKEENQQTLAELARVKEEYAAVQPVRSCVSIVCILGKGSRGPTVL